MGNRTECIDKLAVRLKELESEIRELGELADKAIRRLKLNTGSRSRSIPEKDRSTA